MKLRDGWGVFDYLELIMLGNENVIKIRFIGVEKRSR